MFCRRIIYLLTLAGVLVFQITNDNYLAHFLLGLFIALPILSLLLSLVGMRGLCITLQGQPRQTQRGETARCVLSVNLPGGLPIPRLSLTVELCNLLTGATERKKLTLSGISRQTPLSLDADTSHCGMLEFRVKRLRVYDHLGLFSLPLSRPEPLRLPVGPIPREFGTPDLPRGQGQKAPAGSSAHKSAGEDHELRDYRPGDSMRSVHWKLSSKWDELIVREPVDTLIPTPLLTLDRFGTPEQFDRTLDRLWGCCAALLAAERPHTVLWLSHSGPVRCPVSCERELRACLALLLSSPLPLSGPSILDRPELIGTPGQPAPHLHISGREEDVP